MKKNIFNKNVISKYYENMILNKESDLNYSEINASFSRPQHIMVMTDEPIMPLFT